LEAITGQKALFAAEFIVEMAFAAETFTAVSTGAITGQKEATC